jgi:hypothetical protein
MNISRAPNRRWFAASSSRLALGVSVALAGACSGPEGADPSNLNAIGTPTETSALASPDARAARRAEVEAFVAQRHLKGLRGVVTKAGPFGEVVDWVNPRDLDPAYDSRVPPPASRFPAAEGPAAAAAANGAPLGADIARLWADSKVRGPAGTVPLVRPDFGYYVEGNSPARSLDEFLSSLPTPQPASRNRLYGGKIDTITNIGTQGWVSYFDFAQVPNDGMSLVQLATLCPGTNSATTMEAIEFGIQKNRPVYNDSNLHFFTYFRTAGGAQGDYIGGYNLLVKGFVPYAGAFPPGAIVPTPPAGGQERRLRVTLFNGAWWLQDYVSDTAFTWLGYYPIGTGAGQINFDLINNSSCQVHWYGEVFDPTPTDWTFANMGNGVFGTSAGSAYMRQLFSEGFLFNTWLSTSAVTTPTQDTACYSTSAVNQSVTSGWERWFTLGGPGGDAVGCD